MRRDSLRAFSGQYHANGFRQHDHVQQQRMVFDIVQIVLKLLDRVIHSYNFV